MIIYFSIIFYKLHSCLLILDHIKEKQMISGSKQQNPPFFSHTLELKPLQTVY